jgi:hypothetical protein
MGKIFFAGKVQKNNKLCQEIWHNLFAKSSQIRIFNIGTEIACLFVKIVKTSKYLQSYL